MTDNPREADLKVVVGIPGRMASAWVRRGATVAEALMQAGFAEFDRAVYTIHMNGVPVSGTETVQDRATILLLRPIPAGMSIVLDPTLPYRYNFAHFWRSAASDLWLNLKFGWPIFVVIALYVLGASYLLKQVEPTLASYRQSLYMTWITMATVGYGDVVPKTGVGKFIASVDAFVGIIFVGVVVWLVTTSLSRSDCVQLARRGSLLPPATIPFDPQPAQEQARLATISPRLSIAHHSRRSGKAAQPPRG